MAVDQLVSARTIAEILDCSITYARRLMVEFRAELGAGMVQVTLQQTKVPLKRVEAEPFWEWLKNKHIIEV